MKRILGPLLLTATLAAPSPVSAQVSVDFNGTTPTSTTSGLRGYHIRRPAADNGASGITFELLDSGGNPTPRWDFGLLGNGMEFGLFSHTTGSYQMRQRADTGQMELGQSADTPGNAANQVNKLLNLQLNLTAGTSNAPRRGLGIGVHGNQDGLYLYQKQAASVSRRTRINFDGMYQLGTDTAANGTDNFYLVNATSGRIPLVVNDVNNTDRVYVNHSLQVHEVFRHTGHRVGFYGAVAVTKPVITGSRSDGTALANLLQELHKMGLIEDKTAP